MNTPADNLAPPLSAEGIKEARATLRRVAEHFIGTDQGRALAVADELLAEAQNRMPATGADRIYERRRLLQWLRAVHFRDGSIRDASRGMRQSADRLGRAIPVSQPGATLHRILTICGGEFPSDSTIRDDLRGLANI